MIYLDACRGLNHIGRLGENEHRTVRFWESTEVLAQYPEASVTVLHRRPGDPAAYPVAPGYVEIQDGVVCWTIQSGDLTKVGRGKAELVFTSGEIVAKTMIYDTMIDQALDGTGEAPEPWESWIEEVTEAGEHAPQIIDGEWWAWSVADGAYINTHVQSTGPAGNGIASVALNADYTLTITFTNGSSYTTSSIRGEPGADYVITQQDYAAIAAIVAQDAQFQQKVDAAETAADLAHQITTGEHLNGEPSSEYSENNAKYWAGKSEEYKNAAADLVGDLATEETLQAVEDETETAVELLRQIAEEGQSAGDLNGYSLSRGAGEEVVMTYTDPETAESATIVMITNTTGLAIAAALEDEAKIWKGAVENAS